MTPDLDRDPSASETLGRLGRLFRKELSEMLRDRRTMLTLVLMPVLLYPLLGIAFQQFFLASRIDAKYGLVHKVGFSSSEEERAFLQLMALGEHLLRHSKAQSGQEAKELERLPIDPYVDPDLEQLVLDRKVDVGIRLEPPQLRLPLPDDVEIQAHAVFTAGDPMAQTALVYVERRLQAIHEAGLKSRLFAPAANPKVALVQLNYEPLKGEVADSLISLPALIPLILILMTITGAVYPAIDLTAGERERGTLEILIAAPVPRLGLLFAKYLTVLTIAVLTAFINLVTMMATLTFSGLGQVVFEGSFSAVILLQVFGLLLLFAALFSAVLLSLTSFARSFKEAQAYLIPLMLASLGPGLIGMMPGLQLEGTLAAVPLLNIVLMSRDLLTPNAGVEFGWGLIVVLSTLVYASAAIALAARVFGAESVLYSEQSGWADLLRRPLDPSPTASIASSLWCLALMIPLHFALSGTLRLLAPSLPRAALLVLLTQLALLLFVALPLVSAIWGKIRLASGFGLRPAHPFAWLGALLLGCSVWPILFQMLIWFLSDRLETFRAQLEAQLEALRSDRTTLLPILCASLAIQGVAEEFFFRGYLFTALGRRLNARETIGLTALLFGLMHVLFGSALGWERFVPSTLLGLILGWVRWRTGSVLPCMLLHALHNALLQVVPALDDSQTVWHSIPLEWQFAGAVGMIAGAALILLGSQTRSEFPK